MLLCILYNMCMKCSYVPYQSRVILSEFGNLLDGPVTLSTIFTLVRYFDRTSLFDDHHSKVCCGGRSVKRH